MKNMRRGPKEYMSEAAFSHLKFDHNDAKSRYRYYYGIELPSVGAVVWHRKYGEPYLFLGADGSRLLFSDTGGNVLDDCIDMDHVDVNATEEQANAFWHQFKESGFDYKHGKIIKRKKK
jgi:hypothetical protein